MRLLPCLVGLSLICDLELAERVDVDISGIVYCVHNSSKIATAKVYVYDIAWFGFKTYVGTANVSVDGFYVVNTKIDIGHQLQSQIEIDHCCVRNWNDVPPMTIAIRVNNPGSAFVLSPLILDAERPTEHEFTVFYKEHDYLRQNKDIIRGYDAPNFLFSDLWLLLKNIGFS